MATYIILVRFSLTLDILHCMICNNQFGQIKETESESNRKDNLL